MTSTLLLLIFLCLGSQNLEKRYKLDFFVNETVQLPIGFLVGTSFTIGFLSGGLASILMNINIEAKK
ncbi:hypothetical protein [Prochlorococcus marinus]|uniref:hypothetical protein n=1 Tax=Prochlorococcus marinus TaxID=1219 RepID=UPI0022B35BDC|nr:hypothetical protein [Prochlorococcus marinus]